MSCAIEHRSKLYQYYVKFNSIRYALNFMSQIYSMESPIDTTQAQTVWGSHINTAKWGTLTFAKLSQVCCHGIYCHKCTSQVNNAICKNQVIAIYSFVLWQIATSFSLSCFNIPLDFFKMITDLPNKVAHFQAVDEVLMSCL